MTRPRIALRAPDWLALAAVLLYATLWVGYRQNWGWLHSFDWGLLNPAHDIGTRHRAWVVFWSAVSIVLGPVVLRPLGLVVGVILLVRRRVRAGWFLIACAPSNGAVTWVAKALSDRPRPATAEVFVPETAFPSGHALEVMAVVLALLSLLLPTLKSYPARVFIIALGALTVFTVGAARVALNVHHPSDVVAGWALGYAYFLLCYRVFRPIRSRSGDAIEP